MKLMEFFQRSRALRAFLFLQIIPCVWLAAGSLSGTVTDSNQNPVREARVLVLELNREYSVKRDGRFRFENMPAGAYTLQINAPHFDSKLVTVTLAADQDAEITVNFDIDLHEELTVTATAERKSISDVSQAVGALNEEDLIAKLAPTLGDTLAREPGVTATSFGQGASRPIIRGMGGDRIRILEGGIESGDVSTVSADHALSIDPMSLERVEILRGPASLRYGSSAVGGVVNVIDNRIPEFLPSEPVSGSLDLGFNTVADERSGGVNLNGSRGRLAWHADFYNKETDNYEIPGPAEVEPEEDEELSDTLENSALESRKGSLGFSYITDRGFLGISYTGFETDYGVPGHGHHEEEHGHEEGEEEEEEEEAPVTIDLEQKRFDIRGNYRLDGDFIQSLNLRVGITDYEHVELEGPEVGTQFFNEYREFRGEAVHGERGPFTSGSIGFQYTQREFEAEGAEAFVPPNDSDKYGLYLYEEMDRGSWALNLGLRFDRQNSQAVALAGHGHEEEEEEHHEEEEEEEEPEMFDLDFNGTSASLGLIFAKNAPYGLAINLTRTERAPNPEELFSNGPHLATAAFEVGDPNLDKETSLGLDATLRKKKGEITGELSLFTNRFDDYIFERFTGEEEDGLREFVFIQEDAEFWGAELHVDAALWHSEPNHLSLEFTYDFVRAELDSGEYLPRTPPQRLSIGLHYHRPSFFADATLQFNDEQDRTAPFETPTDDYRLFNAVVGYKFFVAASVHEILLRGVNLTDEEARNHVSFLKDRILLPGRNLSVSYRLKF